MVETQFETQFETEIETQVDTQEVVQELKRVACLDSTGRARGAGKRKAARVSVRILPGEGIIRVNGKDIAEYFKSMSYMIKEVMKPFESVGIVFDVEAKAYGGGLHGQVDALRLAVTRAMIKFNPELYRPLRSDGFVTPDTRIVQSKKYGFVKARKSKPTSRR